MDRVRRGVGGYPELVAVLGAAVIGVCLRGPLAWAASHQGIDVLLAVLVFATALTIEPAALARVARAWRSLTAALAAGITVLPAVSWAVSRIAPAGPLRDGLMTVGLAPCEIASVATTAMAGGDTALAAGVLIGSTATTVLFAGPILTLEAGHTLEAGRALGAGHASVSPGGIVASLAIVVALPLAAGIAVGAKATLAKRAGKIAGRIAMIMVAALVALIAAEVRLSARYAAVALALIAFLAASAALGRLLGTGLGTGTGTDADPGPDASTVADAGLDAGRPARAALLLTTSMRDFAIAAGLAATAFGAPAAAPLGLYGILAMAWGTAAAGALRRHGPGPAAVRGHRPPGRR